LGDVVFLMFLAIFFVCFLLLAIFLLVFKDYREMLIKYIRQYLFQRF
jgi:hypothetical protein